MQPVTTQRRLKCRRKVPCHQRKRGREPTDRWICNQMSKSSNRCPPEKRSYHPSSDRLRKPLKERQCRSTKQDKERSESHEQEMLHHVNGKGNIVKRSQRGANGDPN